MVIAISSFLTLTLTVTLTTLTPPPPPPPWQLAKTTMKTFKIWLLCGQTCGCLPLPFLAPEKGKRQPWLFWLLSPSTQSPVPLPPSYQQLSLNKEPIITDREEKGEAGSSRRMTMITMPRTTIPTTEDDSRWYWWDECRTMRRSSSRLRTEDWVRQGGGWDYLTKQVVGL